MLGLGAGEPERIGLARSTPDAYSDVLVGDLDRLPPPSSRGAAAAIVQTDEQCAGEWDNESDENVIVQVTLTDDYFELVE